MCISVEKTDFPDLIKVNGKAVEVIDGKADNTDLSQEEEKAANDFIRSVNKIQSTITN